MERTLFMNSFNISNVAPGMIVSLGIIAVVFLFAVLALKGYSLWYAAKRDEKLWFIALLLINSLGILEIIYLVFVVRAHRKEISSTNGNTPAQPSQTNA